MQKFQLKKIIISFFLVVVGTLYFTFAFSVGHTVAYKAPSNSTPTLSQNFLNENLAYVYDSLNLEAKGLSEEAFSEAVKGYNTLKKQGKLQNEEVISIADFTRTSDKKRLFVINLKQVKVLFNTYVAHGQNTGREMATKFSNKAESYQSSLGFYLTSGTYIGKNGFSMHLEGLEKGINDMAYERAIVMHGAPYVSENFIHSNGYLGRSWGCPAVPEALTKPIINTIKGGSCLFIYGNNENYNRNSKLIKS